MGKQQRRKGMRVEREIVAELIAAGLPAKKMPLSGQLDGWKGDVAVHAAWPMICESKARADGFKELHEWLLDVDAVILTANRRPKLIVMRLADWGEMIATLQKVASKLECQQEPVATGKDA